MREFVTLRVLVSTLTTLCFTVNAGAAVPPTTSTSAAVSKPQIAATMMGMPLQFEANHGQVDSAVKFISRGSGYTLFLTPTESVMVLQQREAKEPASDIHDPLASIEPAPIKQSVVRMKLEGANPSPAIDGMEQLPGIVNYFIGNDPAKWRTKIPTYAKVQYKEAYPGIDLAYYGNQGKLEYDFIVAPGADPNQIKLAFEGVSDIRVADSGDLLLTTALGEVRVQKPIVYQLEEDGHKTLVAGSYLASPNASKGVSIQLAAYDHTRPIVIDPVLLYSSFLGATTSTQAHGIVADTAGNALVAGFGGALTLPVVGTPFDATFGGTNDVNVWKVDPSGTLLSWTYLGGSFNDHTPSIALDATGNVWVTGTTGGAGFPITTGSLQPVAGGSGDSFVAKLSPDLSTLLYSTFYGGSGPDSAYSIAVDPSGTIVYITGETSSSNLPGVTASSIQSSYGGGIDGFVGKINIALGQIEIATYLGGGSRDGLRKIRVDAGGNIHVAGFSTSSGFPGTAGSPIPSLASFQPNFAGGATGFVFDAVVAKINSTGTQLLYSTYLGGGASPGDESANGLALDSAGNAVVSGYTGSSDFPLAGTPFQSVQSNHDYFITKFNAAGTALIFSTRFGGNGDDFSSVVALDQSDNIFVAGRTSSCRIPNNGHPLAINTCSLPQPHQHAVVAELDPSGSQLLSLFAFYGGSGISPLAGIFVDSHRNAYVAGTTRATDFTILNAFQSVHGTGEDDGYVAKITYRPLANAGPDQSVPEGTLVTLDGTGSTGGSLTYIWTQVAGTSVALGNATTVHPTFAAPHVLPAGGTVTFELVVCEGTSSNCSDPDTVNVHITNVNQPPVAQAGPDQTVHEGSAVLLDGTASYDPDIEAVTYTWLHLYGPTVTLTNPLTATPSFTAPSVGAGGARVDFELIVSDLHGLNHSDYVSIFITNVNQPPVAHAGPDQTKNEHTLVTLDGGASHDPDLDFLTYHWGQTGGPLVALSSATSINPTFTAPEVAAGGALVTFQLTVNDGHVSSAADLVQIAVVNVNDPPVCTLAQASPALLWPPNHTMVPVSVLGVTDPNNQAITITYTAVTQDEPINGLGDGDMTPDAAVSGNQILLRAERAGTGNGRVYVVHFTASDGQGGSCSGTVKVSVPHSKKDPAVEGQQLYNSFGP